MFDLMSYMMGQSNKNNGGTPKRITISMMENIIWPELTLIQNNEQGVMYIPEKAVNEIAGPNYQDYSFYIFFESIKLQATESAEDYVIYKPIDDSSDFKAIHIFPNNYVEIIIPGFGSNPETSFDFSYDENEKIYRYAEVQ